MAPQRHLVWTVVAAVTGLGFPTGCAHIEEKRSIIDGARTVVRVESAPTSQSNARLAVLSNGDFAIRVQGSGQCDEREVAAIEQKVRIERKARSLGEVVGLPLVSGALGLSSIGLGVAMLAPPDPNEMSPLSPEARRRVGIGSLVVGGVLSLAAVAIVAMELYRSRDSIEPMPTREEVQRRRVSCEAAPLVGAPIVLRAGGATVTSGSTDESGSLVVPRSSAATAASPWTVSVVGVDVPLQFEANAEAALVQLRAEREEEIRVGAVRRAEQEQRIKEAEQAVADPKALATSRLILKAIAPLGTGAVLIAPDGWLRLKCERLISGLQQAADRSVGKELATIRKRLATASQCVTQQEALYAGAQPIIADEQAMLEATILQEARPAPAGSPLETRAQAAAKALPVFQERIDRWTKAYGEHREFLERLETESKEELTR